MAALALSAASRPSPARDGIRLTRNASKEASSAIPKRSPSVNVHASVSSLGERRAAGPGQATLRAAAVEAWPGARRQRESEARKPRQRCVICACVRGAAARRVVAAALVANVPFGLRADGISVEIARYWRRGNVMRERSMMKYNGIRGASTNNRERPS